MLVIALYIEDKTVLLNKVHSEHSNIKNIFIYLTLQRGKTKQTKIFSENIQRSPSSLVLRTI